MSKFLQLIVRLKLAHFNKTLSRHRPLRSSALFISNPIRKNSVYRRLHRSRASKILGNLAWIIIKQIIKQENTARQFYRGARRERMRAPRFSKTHAQRDIYLPHTPPYGFFGCCSLSRENTCVRTRGSWNLHWDLKMSSLDSAAVESSVQTMDTQRMKNLKDGVIDFVAGSLGGVALVYVGQPLDTVKVKMQTFPTLYNGMVDCFMKTLRTDGVARGLYAGTMPSIVANVAENSILFAAYGGCQKAVASVLGVPKVEDLSSLGNAWAGFFAAFFSSLTLCPTELIKCRLQAMREVQNQRKTAGAKVEFIGPWTLTRQILKESGVPGLFRGLTSTIAREMPGYFFFFGGYELTRELLAKPGQSRDEIGWQKTMVAGAVGGSVLWLVIFPADVVKSRIQVQGLRTPALAVMKEIVRTEGASALYNGLKPTLIRTVPATATLFLTYEYVKKFMHQVMD